jgi:hypothetical protein
MNVVAGWRVNPWRHKDQATYLLSVVHHTSYFLSSITRFHLRYMVMIAPGDRFWLESEAIRESFSHR